MFAYIYTYFVSIASRLFFFTVLIAIFVSQTLLCCFYRSFSVYTTFCFSFLPSVVFGFDIIIHGSSALSALYVFHFYYGAEHIATSVHDFRFRTIVFFDTVNISSSNISFPIRFIRRFLCVSGCERACVWRSNKPSLIWMFKTIRQCGCAKRIHVWMCSFGDPVV